MFYIIFSRFHSYVYALNNPLTYIDPTGMDPYMPEYNGWMEPDDGEPPDYRYRMDGGGGPGYQPGWYESFNSTFVPYIGTVSNNDILASFSGQDAKNYYAGLVYRNIEKGNTPGSGVITSSVDGDGNIQTVYESGIVVTKNYATGTYLIEFGVNCYHWSGNSSLSLINIGTEIYISGDQSTIYGVSPVFSNNSITNSDGFIGKFRSMYNETKKWSLERNPSFLNRYILYAPYTKPLVFIGYAISESIYHIVNFMPPDPRGPIKHRIRTDPRIDENQKLILELMIEYGN